MNPNDHSIIICAATEYLSGLNSDLSQYRIHSNWTGLGENLDWMLYDKHLCIGVRVMI